jgi:hypothetical protein
MTLYHGTSADNLPAICEHGFDGERGLQLWNCSGGLNYFWSVKDVAKSEGIEDENEEYQNQITFGRAKSSAECALVRAKDCRRVVFKLEIPEEFYSKNFRADDSCENMSGAVVCDSAIPYEYVTEIQIDAADLSFFRPYFGQFLLSNKLASDLDLTDAEAAMIKALSKSDAVHDIMDFLDSSEMEICAK